MTKAQAEQIAEFSRPCEKLPIIGLERVPIGAGGWGVFLALLFVGAFLFGGGVR